MNPDAFIKLGPGVGFRLELGRNLYPNSMLLNYLICKNAYGIIRLCFEKQSFRGYKKSPFLVS